MAKIDLTLTPEQYRAKWVEANKETVKGEKKAVEKMWGEIKALVEKIKVVDSDYVAPYEPAPRVKYTDLVKARLSQEDDKTMNVAELVEELKEKEPTIQRKLEAASTKPRTAFKFSNGMSGTISLKK